MATHCLLNQSLTVNCIVKILHYIWYINIFLILVNLAVGLIGPYTFPSNNYTNPTSDALSITTINGTNHPTVTKQMIALQTTAENLHFILYLRVKCNSTNTTLVVFQKGGLAFTFHGLVNSVKPWTFELHFYRSRPLAICR